MHQIPLQGVERSAGYHTNMWLGVLLMKENHLPFELIFTFFTNGIGNFDYHCAVDSLSAFQVLLRDNSLTIPPDTEKHFLLVSVRLAAEPADPRELTSLLHGLYCCSTPIFHLRSQFCPQCSFLQSLSRAKQVAFLLLLSSAVYS
ncbi:hypothetical protein TNCV_3772711 [Trichonephila clavipes]|nr:hypothetical protein TNCV_3772711 [Trichonephila clavipes]